VCVHLLVLGLELRPLPLEPHLQPFLLLLFFEYGLAFMSTILHFCLPHSLIDNVRYHTQLLLVVTGSPKLYVQAGLEL
jgi:hypothetical protein